MSFSQHIILFMTYKWAQKARVFLPAKPFWLSVMQHYYVLGKYISYKVNDTGHVIKRDVVVIDAIEII
jgi:hypothetical protein